MAESCAGLQDSGRSCRARRYRIFGQRGRHPSHPLEIFALGGAISCTFRRHPGGSGSTDGLGAYSGAACFVLLAATPAGAEEISGVSGTLPYVDSITIRTADGIRALEPGPWKVVVDKIEDAVTRGRHMKCCSEEGNSWRNPGNALIEVQYHDQRLLKIPAPGVTASQVIRLFVFCRLGNEWLHLGVNTDRGSENPINTQGGGDELCKLVGVVPHVSRKRVPHPRERGSQSASRQQPHSRRTISK